MKKVMILVALAAAALVSCKKETGSGHADDGEAIRFTTSVMTVTQTRNPVLGTSFDDNTDIGIFTVTNQDGGSDWSDIVMDNVNGTIVGSAVTYNPEINYPSEGTVNFYAYHPYDLTVQSSGSVPAITIVEGGETDYMWAAEDNSGRGYTSRPGRVTLNFNHAMSLVNVKVQKRQNVTEEITLTGISLTSPASQNGTMDISNGTITSDSSAGVTYSKLGMTIAVPQQGGTEINDISEAVAVGSYMFIPGSTLTEIMLTPDQGESFAATLNNVTLERGKAYDLVATFSGKTITFTINDTVWGTLPDDGGTVYLTERTIQSAIQVGEIGWTPDSDQIELSKKGE